MYIYYIYIQGIYVYILYILGWYDKIQILDFGLTHKTGGAKHKINDFCFLKFFILIKFDPHQAQKMIFCRFEQCGISLDMLEGSNDLCFRT